MQSSSNSVIFEKVATGTEIVVIMRSVIPMGAANAVGKVVLVAINARGTEIVIPTSSAIMDAVKTRTVAVVATNATGTEIVVIMSSAMRIDAAKTRTVAVVGEVTIVEGAEVPIGSALGLVAATVRSARVGTVMVRFYYFVHHYKIALLLTHSA